MSSQMLQIIVLAGVALFLVLQLRRVLGTRDGFEKTTDQSVKPVVHKSNGAGDFEVIEGGGIDPDVSEFAEAGSDMAKALSAMKAAEPGFSVTDFAGGARGAYEMILMAYERGDIETLRNLLSPDVFEGFKSAIEAREDQGLTVDAEFIGVREVKMTGASYDAVNQEAEITIRFVGEMSSAVKDDEGRIVEGDPNAIKKQRDIWTFARLMGTDNPNWLLVATEQ